MNKKIIQLAIPNIVSNITVPLLGLVDLTLMGHLNSDVFIGAVALGTVIFNFIYWGFGFLRMSTSGFTSQSYGQKDKVESFSILIRALLISALISLTLIALQKPIGWLSFHLINGSSDVEELANEYFRIRIWAAPATLGLYVMNGWFLGMQNARFPMLISILSNVFNILFSFLFVMVFHLTLKGVALGTVLAQYLGLIIAIVLFFRKYRPMIQLWDTKAIFRQTAIRNFFGVNKDIFIRTFCLVGVFTFFTSKSAGINDHILAVNSLLLQFLMFFSYFVDGFAYAGEALSGKYFGRQRLDQLRRLTQKLLLWGAFLAISFSVLFWIGNSVILHILTNQKDLIATAGNYRLWIIALPLFAFSSYIWDGIYIGATASVQMRNSMLAATFLVFIPVYFSLQSSLGNHALWLAMSLFLLSRGVFQTFLFPSILRKQNAMAKTKIF